MGLTIGSKVIADITWSMTLTTSAGQAVNDLSRTTTYMTLSRYHMDLKESAKKIVRTKLPSITPLAALFTVAKVVSSVNSVLSPSICFGSTILDCVPFFMFDVPSV